MFNYFHLYLVTTKYDEGLLHTTYVCGNTWLGKVNMYTELLLKSGTYCRSLPLNNKY
jgi:hypothetical protein